jgi:3'-5' exoribonuclease
MVADKVSRLPDFPRELRALVDHMILSHHGQLEFGSPKLPQFPEALLLHYIDDMDSKMECMRALIANDRQVEGCFTTYSSALERPALKKSRYLNPEPEPPKPLQSNGTSGSSQRAPVPSEAALHPLFASKPVSVFADKLKEALAPAEPEPEN